MWKEILQLNRWLFYASVYQFNNTCLSNFSLKLASSMVDSLGSQWTISGLQNWAFAPQKVPAYSPVYQGFINIFRRVLNFPLLEIFPSVHWRFVLRKFLRFEILTVITFLSLHFKLLPESPKRLKKPAICFLKIIRNYNFAWKNSNVFANNCPFRSPSTTTYL